MQEVGVGFHTDALPAGHRLGEGLSPLWKAATTLLFALFQGESPAQLHESGSRHVRPLHLVG